MGRTNEEVTELESRLTRIIKDAKTELRLAVNERSAELEGESPEYYKLMGILGFGVEESTKIDKYHNIGRIVYRHLGSILEELTLTVLLDCIGGTRKVKIKNRQGGSPVNFWVDWVNKNRAYEIKWRYATTDGTTINKEIALVKQLSQDGYVPIFLTFYVPLRDQPLACFNRIASSFTDHGGEVYSGQEAWDHIKSISGFDLKKFVFQYKDAP